MKISIITVTYNSAATIADTLATVDAQTYANIEHIVVDGGSRDGTLDIIAQSDRPWRRVISESDDGIYDAMNKGIALATGEVVGFLNSDDVFADSSVIQQIADAMSPPQVDACYADLLYVHDLTSEHIVRYWKGREYVPGLCQSGWMPAHPTLYIKREIFAKYGGFDTQFKRQADYELSLRFFDIHRVRSVYVPKIWVKMRTGGVSNSSIIGILKGNLEAYRACRKHGLNVTPLFIARKIISRIPQFLFKP